MFQTTTLLVDDNPRFLAAAARFLAAHTQFLVVGQACSGAEAVEQVTALQPALVLMDWQMPEMDGLEATRRLKGLGCPPQVVIVTEHDLPRYRAAAQSAGADGYITKGEFGSQLSALIADITIQKSTDQNKVVASSNRS
jgi:DNA-binding NarL/FixJ family response regulator